MPEGQEALAGRTISALRPSGATREMRLLRQNPSGRASAGSPPRFGSLIWNDQTTLAEAGAEPPAETRRARAELFKGSLISVHDHAVRPQVTESRAGAVAHTSPRTPANQLNQACFRAFRVISKLIGLNPARRPCHDRHRHHLHPIERQSRARPTPADPGVRTR